MTKDGPAALSLEIDPGLVDAVGILDLHAWIAHGERPDPFAGLLGMVEFLRQLRDQSIVECLACHVSCSQCATLGKTHCTMSNDILGSGKIDCELRQGVARIYRQDHMGECHGC